jgi:cytochrome c551/c552
VLVFKFFINYDKQREKLVGSKNSTAAGNILMKIADRYQGFEKQLAKLADKKKKVKGIVRFNKRWARLKQQIAKLMGLLQK